VYALYYKIRISKTINLEEDIKLAHEQNDRGKGAQGCKVQVARHTALSLGINNMHTVFIDFMTIFYSVYIYTWLEQALWNI
jgi:hypothetical protein